MKGIYHSTSRFIFLIITLTACYAFVFTGALSEENFMLLATAAFSFFFTKSQPDTKENTTITKLETTTPPTTG